MAEDEMTAAGRLWMRGELDSRDYFAMARRQTVPRRARPGWWLRLRRLWRRP